jgi:creatinine amidohydrolase
MTLVEMRYLTWPQAREIAGDGTAIGLIPVGSLEQHGPHLPLITDTAIAEALVAAAAARVVEPVVVAPAFPGGLSDHHLAFSGTVSLSRDVFAGLLRAYVAGMERMGISRIGIMSGHGGNFRFIGELGRELSEDPARAMIVGFDDLDGFLQTTMEAGRAAGLSPSSTDVHAGVLETSMILYLLGPERVGDFAEVSGLTSADPGFLDTVYKRGIHTMSPSGVFGTPAGATAEAGSVIMDAVVDLVVRWLAETFGVTPIWASPHLSTPSPMLGEGE